MTDYTFSFVEDTPDDDKGVYGTYAEALNAAQEFHNKFHEDDYLDEIFYRDVWISEIVVCNNDENEVLSTKVDEVKTLKPDGPMVPHNYTSDWKGFRV